MMVNGLTVATALWETLIVSPEGAGDAIAIEKKCRVVGTLRRWRQKRNVRS
jgi:hypothetical protein